MEMFTGPRTCSEAMRIQQERYLASQRNTPKKLVLSAKQQRQKRKEQEPYDPRKHGVSVSGLTLWLTCREAFRLRYLVGAAGTRSNALVQGSSYHELLQDYYCAMANGELEDPMEAREYAERSVAIAEKRALKNTASDTQIVMDTLLKAGAVIPEYAEHYYDFDSSVEWTHVEDLFRFSVKTAQGAVIPFKGKMDGGYIEESKQWLFETKFKARWNEAYIDSLALDLQIGCYLVALLEEGTTPKGCMFNIVRKPELRQKKQEPRKVYLARIVDDIRDRPMWYFNRTKVVFTEREIAFLVRRTKHIVSEFYAWWESSSYGIRDRDMLWNHSACDGKYGACRFIDICTDGELCGPKVSKK